MKKKAICPKDGCSIGYVEVIDGVKEYTVECFRCEEDEHIINVHDLRDLQDYDYKILYEELEESIQTIVFTILCDLRMSYTTEKMKEKLEYTLSIFKELAKEQQINLDIDRTNKGINMLIAAADETAKEIKDKFGSKEN